MQDLIERLDAELTRAPDPTFDIPGTLVSGRRAVRRRRLAVGAAGLAAVVVVGGTAALAFDGGGTTSGRDGNVADTPTPTATASASASTSEGDAAEEVPGGWDPDVLLLVLDDGTITVNPDAEVIERGDFTATNGKTGEVFRLSLGDREYYAVADRAGYSSTPVPAQGLTLREWAEQTLTLDEDNGASDRSWVTIDAQSNLKAKPGVEVFVWRPDPGLGDNFAAPGVPTAVAQVVRDGFVFFLAVRQAPDGSTEAISYRKDDAVTTLDEFLAYARDQYATNEQGGSEGLR